MTLITASLLNQDDAFRRAFTQISTKALPLMAPNGYFTDLLYNAASAASLPTCGRSYLLVRELGTNYFEDPADAMRHCAESANCKAVLRVTRGMYENFNVDVLYTKDGGLSLPE